MKAKKEYAVLFLVLIVGVSTFMSVCRAEDLSVDEEFELYVDYLDDYLADPYSADSYDINSLCDSIGEVRGHAGDIGMAFYAYAMVIRDLDQEEWDSVNFNLSIIDSITNFEEYVSSEEFRKEHRQIKGVDVLRTYCEGRVAEANNQWKEAAECYMATVSFYDSFSRLQIAQTNNQMNKYKSAEQMLKDGGYNWYNNEAGNYFAILVEGDIDGNVNELMLWLREGYSIPSIIYKVSKEGIGDYTSDLLDNDDRVAALLLCGFNQLDINETIGESMQRGIPVWISDKAGYSDIKEEIGNLLNNIYDSRN